MKKSLLFLSFMVSLLMSFGLQAQTIPGDSIVYGPMMSPVYNNSVRVWVLTKNNTGSGDELSISFTQNGTENTPLTGTVYNSDDRLGYSLRSFEYSGLTEGASYTAQVLENGAASGRETSITNGQNTLSDFEFLSGGCGRIYDLSRCIDQPEAEFHFNGTPTMFNVMAEEESDLMVWLGDAVYLLGLQHAMGQCPDGVDDWANKDMAFDRYRFFRNFHDSLTVAMPQLAITDNHDLGPNEFNKTLPTIGEMREIFMDWWPNPEYNSTPEGQGLFSSYVYKDVEYFLLDNRSYRDGISQHLGPDQLQWLKNGLLNSTATFKVLINGTPSFERNCGGRNFCNTTQSQELINYIKDNNINGVLSLSADIHEQKFMIRDGDVNYPLYDVLSGNINSDVGSGNYNINYNSNYILTGVKQTYLRINVYGDADDRRMKVEYVDSVGQPYFETIIHEDMLTSQNADALKLEMGIENSILDGSDYNHTINAENYAFAVDRDDVANGALQFGATTSVSIPYATAFDMHDRPFSLAFWVKPEQFTSTGSVIFSNGAEGQGMSLGISPNGKLTYTDHATGATLSTEYNLLVNQWSYIVWKYDNVKRKLSVYYNGFLIQEWSNIVTPIASEADITIGNNFQDKKYIGLLDKLNLYGRIISDEAIMEEADFESTRGDILKMAGGQDMVIPSEVVNDVLSNDFTIEFWGKLTSDPGNNFKIVASNGRVNNLTTGISFEFPDNNKLNVVVGTNGSGWNTISGQGDVWNIGEWNHVALSVTKNGTMTYYVNGQEIGSASFGEYVPNPFGLGFGRSPAYSDSLQAELDEFRIWERALTADEINQQMHYHLTGDEQDLALYFDFSAADEDEDSFISLGAVEQEIFLNGGVFATATSPVSVLPTEYQEVVTGKWSRNNNVNNSGLTFPNNITAYNSNIVVGKQNIETTAVVPGNEEMTYLQGGWRIDPLSTPFATVKINLEESITDYETITQIAGQFYLLKQEEGSEEFTNVAEGSFDGQNVTFYNANLTEGTYYVAWSVAEFVPGRGGALSLTGGHDVTIPYEDMNPIMEGAFTLEFWLNLTQDPGNNAPVVSSHGKINGNSTGFTMELPDNNSISAVFGTNTSAWNNINSGTPLIVGEWNHIAVTASPGGMIKLYVNGELKAENAFADFVPNQNWDFAFGKSINYGGQSYSMMDEFRIWDHVKTEAEIVEQMHMILEEGQDGLLYNFNFDQEDNGTLENAGGTQTTVVSYTNATIVNSTSPVSVVNEEFPDQVTGNWSITNETLNGLYVNGGITNYTQNLVVSRNNTNEVLPLGEDDDNKYISGGWHLNALNMSVANLEVDLATVIEDFAAVNATVAQYSLIKGDPNSTYQTVATATEENGVVVFEDVDIAIGNYYLAFEIDPAAAIIAQGGVLSLEAGHDVQLPKEGVNAALSGEFTIELWARLREPSASNRKLVGFTSFNGGNYGWEMEFLGNQTLQTITGQGAGGGWNSLNSDHVWEVNEWNHVAVTFVPNGEFKFYINGELVDSMQVGEFQPNANNLAFGRNIANDAPTSSDIDEFRIWSTAKTIEEIREDMYLTINDITDNLVYNYTFNQDDSGYLVNSGSEAVEVAYINASIQPATNPVRDMEAPFRNAVKGNWSVMNDNGNGMYLTNEIESVNNNVVIGKELGTDVLHALNDTENDTLYINSRWMPNTLFIDNASLSVDVSKVFENPNDVNTLATTYFLLAGDPATEINVVATGTKLGSIVTFTEIPLDGTPVYLAWLESSTEYPVGTFPIAAQSLWKYNDNGVDLGTEWTAVEYDDADWMFGNGVLGYGDGVEATMLSYGEDANNKYPTYYFRHTFNVEDASQIGSLLFHTLKDDGVVVYVNGVEAFRTNMPEGAVTYNTYASSTVGGEDETTYELVETANLLQNGTNVIAVELHQASANSSDLGFDMEVNFNLPPLEPASYPLPKGETWAYLDNGTSLDNTEWSALTYDNNSWDRGEAPLGYGDPMKTTISYGPDSSNKYITYYFTRDIEINLADVADNVEFGLRRDDGAVVYVNGVEIFRDNMAEGDFDYLTTSASTVDGANEKRYFSHILPKTVFQEGVNRISVEMHNRDGQSSDISFDMYIKDAPQDMEVCDEDHIACFTSINPTGQTSNLIISEDHRFQLLFKQGEAYMDGSGNVPGNNDFSAYVATEGSSELGHLSVNHENTPGGVSMLDIHLNTDDQLWEVDYSQPVDFYNNDLVTTTRNCSGGITPWGTVITAEENTASGDANGDGYDDEGWLVEIDPVTAQVMEYGNGKQEKLWAMGRMNHENVVIKADGSAAYYGEDGGTHCVYKFVPDVPGNLYSGTVYVLHLDVEMSDNEPSSAKARWIQVPNTTQADRNNLSTVAASVGGTNFNGVEDCEISPFDGKIYFTAKGRNRIYRFTDPASVNDTITDFETFAGGMSYDIETANGTVNEAWGDGNDNLVFDDKGNLWVCQDGGLNYIWVIRPDHSQNEPKIELFASMPAGSEPTGLTFTPDFKYGFFSVQHPNGGNAPQQDATFNDVTFNASATVVFSLNQYLGAQAPVVDFVADQVEVEEGETVTFTDLSTNNPTEWSWTFEGGEPATSTEQNPTVTYAEAGTYDVTLIATNVAGNQSLTKEEYIIVEEALGIDTPNPLKDKVSLYPNPTNGKVTVEINDEGGKDVVVDVYDLVGRKTTTINAQTTGGTQTINLNLTQLQGEQVFIINVKVGDKTGTYKMLKVNR